MEKRYPATISNRRIRAYLTLFPPARWSGASRRRTRQSTRRRCWGPQHGAGSGSGAGWCSGMTAGCSRARSQSAGGCGALLAALGLYLRRIPRWPPRGEREADGVHSSGDGGGALAWARTWAGLFELQLVLAAGARSRAAGLPLADDARRRGMHTPAAVTARGEQMGGAGDGGHSSGGGGCLHGKDLAPGLAAACLGCCLLGCRCCRCRPAAAVCAPARRPPAVSQRGEVTAGSAPSTARRGGARVPRPPFGGGRVPAMRGQTAIWVEITR